MEYYYITNEKDLIVKTNELVREGQVEFSGTVIRATPEQMEEGLYNIDSFGENWVTEHFKLMSEDELKDIFTDEEMEMLKTEYRVIDIEDGGWIIVGQCTYFGGKDDKMYFNGVIEYLSNVEGKFMGDLYDGGITNESKLINGLELQNIIDENNFLFKIPEDHKFTVIYSDFFGHGSHRSSIVKMLHIVWNEEDLNDVLESHGVEVTQVNFIFDGHLKETES